MTVRVLHLCLLSLLFGCTVSFSPSSSFLAKNHHRHKSVLLAKRQTTGENSRKEADEEVAVGGLVLPNPNMLMDWTKGVADDIKSSITTVVNNTTMRVLSDFTGKETYNFGDLSKEILSRVESGQYSDDDIRFLSRLIVGVAVGLTPMARFAPVRLVLKDNDIPDNDEIQEILWRGLYDKLREAIKEGDPEEENRIKDTAKTLLGVIEGEFKLNDIATMTKELLIEILP